MKSVIYSRTLLAATMAFVVGTSIAASDNGVSNAKRLSVLDDDVPAGSSFAHQVPSPKEKEYRELAHGLRAQDVAFEKEWRSAKAADRQALRTKRQEKLQPTLARMNVLARQIANERKASSQSSPKPVPVSAPLTPPDEIKGKTERELEQMGIPVRALHQKKEAKVEDTGAGEATTSPTKN